MNIDRLKQIEDLYRAAAQIPEPKREAFLAELCTGDESLHRAVEALLRRDTSGLIKKLKEGGMDRREAIRQAIADAEGETKPTVAILMAGAAMGPYLVEEQLGQGGMGEIYRARDTRLGRAVALKLLSPALAADEAALERFRREAQAISALNHPNVCTIHDIGAESGRPYLVIELLEGQTLKERIAEGPFSLEELVPVVTGILNGLEAAHAAGLVHRDIKPANVFLTRNGLVKILDFGLAKGAGPESAPLGFEDSLTAPGTTVGTISYMSPEQARGRTVDARSDLFACGVTLYEMATGSLPFRGDSWAATIDAVLNRTPRAPRQLNRALAPEIEAVILRAIEKDPQSRYQSAADMRADLQRAQRAIDARNAPLPTEAPHRKKIGMYASAAAGCAAALFAGWYFGIRKVPVTSPSEYVQLTDLNDSASSPALSSDGRMVAFFGGGEPFITSSQVYVKLLPNGQATQLTNDPSEKYNAVFTPDGSRIAYTSVANEDYSFNTWTVLVTGGTSTRLMRNAAGLSWIGPHTILFSEIEQGTALHMGVVTSLESRAEERRIYFPGHQRAMAHYSYLSPDRKFILVVEMDGTGAFQRCKLVSMAGGSDSVEVGPAGSCMAAAWSPDGKWMYFNVSKNGVDPYSVNGSSHLWRQRFPDGAPEQITFGPGEEEGLAMSPDGKSIVSSVGIRKSSVWIHDASGERAIPVEGAASSPVMSADGRRVFYLLRKKAAGVSELWSTDRASGKSDAALPGVSMTDFDISRDSQRVAFTTGQDRRIMLAPLDGSGPPRQMVQGGDTVTFGVPGELIFRQVTERANYLARVKTDGTGMERVTNEPIIAKHSVSPDGTWVEAGFAAKGDIAIVVYNLTNGARRNLCRSVCVSAWSPDGRLMYVTNVRRPYATLVLPVNRADGLPDLPESGLSANAAAEIPGIRVIHEAGLAPGPDPGIYAFERFEFAGNLYRIPLH
jgi:serine/threonine protein kinase